MFADAIDSPRERLQQRGAVVVLEHMRAAALAEFHAFSTSTATPRGPKFGPAYANRQWSCP